jgi:predicted DNA-binding transcriptional regulator AlpA
MVSEKYSHYPGFPPAIRIPSPKGKGVYRWKREEIAEWVESLVVKK